MELLGVPFSIGRVFRAQFEMQRRGLVLLAALLILAAGLRLVAIDRHPMHNFAALYQDEQKIINNTLAQMSGENIAVHYPLGLYKPLVPQMEAAKLVTFWKSPPPEGRWRERNLDFKAETRANPLPYFVLLRLNMVVVSLLLVLQLFAVSRYLAGLRAAFVVAAFASVFPMFVVYSKMAYYDLPMTFWHTTTVCVIGWTWKRRSLAGLYWASALFAYTFCTKQNAVTLGPLWLSCVVHVCALRLEQPWHQAWRSRHLWGCGVLAIVVLLWGYPTVLDPEAMKLFREKLDNTYYTLDGTTTVPPNWRGWWTEHWPHQAHFLVFPFLVGGLALLVRERKDDALLRAFVVSALMYFLIAGRSSHSLDRTMMPLLPAFCLGTAGWVLFLEGQNGKPARFAIIAGLGLSLLSLFQNTVRFNLLISATDTRELAIAGVEANAKPGDRILKENYGPYLPRLQKKSYLYKRASEGELKRPIYDVVHRPSLGNDSIKRIRSRKYDYLLLTSRLEEEAVALQPWADEPELAYQLRKYELPLAQVAENYAAIKKHYTNAIAWEAKLPPSSLLRGVIPENYVPDEEREPELPFFRRGSFFNPDIITLWRNHEDYVLGPRIELRARKELRDAKPE